MRTVIIRATGGPEVLELIDAPEPEPGPGEVVVRSHAMGVGWPDILIRKGVYNWMPPLPASPGSELAGRIAALGPGVTDFAVGQGVLVSARNLATRGGCYTEMIAVPAAALYRLPEAADLDEAACLGNFQVAWAILFETTRGFDPKSVLVMGAAGGVGSAAVQLARHAGMRVIGTVSSDEKAAFARRQGADGLIDYRRENVVERVRELTDGRGVDLILDHVGGAAFNDNFAMLAPWGTIVSYGNLGGTPETGLFEQLRDSGTKGAAVRAFSMHLYDHDPAARRRVMDRVIALFGAGAIRPPIGARLTMDRAGEAQAMVEAGNALGRVILKP
jgi:NADPH2:quinone reductase